MAEKVPQSLSNHTRFDPPFHFFVLPVFAITVIIAIVHLVQYPSLHAAWLVVFMLAATVAAVKTRTYALKVQDRVIRLEERLRLAILVDKPLRARIVELTEPQLVGLRFASDAELPGLAARALSEKLSKAEIKKAITQWRPDYWRV
ncbi:MAG: DUF6526 family protein [Acidobacteriia bacterium]|jgi:hypothetical protein|nr:DUF6526 family protein [Terriglobia bacterium]